MRRLGWVVMAALAGMVTGCADDTALYTNPKYVPGYTPPGSVSIASSYERQQARIRRADGRER